MDSEEVQAETITRLVDLAIAATVRGAPRVEAADELCVAAASNPALLAAAATTARRIADDSGRTDYLEAAVAHLDAAHQAARGRARP